MARNRLAIKQLLIGFQRAYGIKSIEEPEKKTLTETDRKERRLYDLLRLMSKELEEVAVESETNTTSINTITSGDTTNIVEGSTGLTHGQVMRRIGVGI